ncbi:hypothetical protein [Streptomyces muensis]|uniref:Uncharacterized protein n=1 Tax=Streptomyces muensis TaxID=1077944 RepID=A0A9X1PYY8_STRM4|nr:hypothetical protein [Streptomyces muensis]MCF1595583.1 hypothetical protein [Streptomyces muensis]
MASLVSLSLLTACTSGDTGGKKTADSNHASPTDQSVATTSPHTTSPSGQVPPELDADETLAGRQNPTSGNASVAYKEGKKGDALIVAVRCQGQGEIKVSVPSVHVSFPLECLANEVSTTYNQLAVSGVDRSGTVSVAAPSPIRWSMTIGRGVPTKEEPPRTQ